MLIIRKVLLTTVALLALVYGGLVIYAYWPYGEGIPVEELAGPDDLFVDVAGMQLRYRSWGTPAAGQPALVLIHGFANSLETFNRLAPYLENDYRVIALDMPGFGLSAKPPQHDYSNASQAKVIADFITAAKLDTVVIGGHSMGGALAVHAALLAPQTAGLILFNPGIITTGVPPATEYFFFPLPRLAAKTFGNRQFRKMFITGSYLDADLLTEAALDDLMLGPMSAGYIEGATTLMSYYKSGDEVSMLADIDLPTLIVWGALDKRKPAGEATELRDMIRGSRLAVIDTAAHYVHVEQPAAAAQAIIDAKDFWLPAARTTEP